MPALPLVLWLPQVRATLVDARSKRARFLTAVVHQLDLSERVQVVEARIEEVIDEYRNQDVVTARSFGPPSATLEIASGLLMVGGSALIAEPPGGRLWAAHGLERLGVVQRSAPGASVAVFERVGSTPPPRRWKHMIESPVVEVRVRN
ncbi:MAG: hypothetical protein HKN24_12575 [Acidimicrobiales bacterium]|nr:hypothetical protein [Acidimicrobiales bacterium]